MAYTKNNYNFVIDSSFQPFTFQEMLTPLNMYKEAYEKADEEYQQIKEKADVFKYLSESLPPGSKAREIYEQYANDLSGYVNDFSTHGLSMSNRRGLSSMKKRYSGEIGRLARADERRKEYLKTRMTKDASDSSMIYATNNWTIDDFLDDNTPNMYGVSGTELYTKGAATGKAISSRYYDSMDGGSTLNGYYRKWINKKGIGPESIAEFMEDDVVKNAIQQAMDAEGVTQNLTGEAKDRAIANFKRGFFDGIVHEITTTPMQDLGRLTAAQEADVALRKESNSIQRAELAFKQTEAKKAREAQELMYTLNGIYYDEDTKTWKQDARRDVLGKAALSRQLMAKQMGLTDSSGYAADVNPGKPTLPKPPKAGGTSSDKEEKAQLKEEDAVIAALNKKEEGKKDFFGNDEGFSITVGSGGSAKTYNFSYLGAAIKHHGEWFAGKLGLDDPKVKGLGLFRSTNLLHLGNFSASNVANSGVVHVLSREEKEQLLNNSFNDDGTEMPKAEKLKEFLSEQGYKPSDRNVVIIKVKGRSGLGGGGEHPHYDYLIAVTDNLPK